MSLEKFLDQVDDGVDPRVQVELERLNSATDEINKLEVDLDEARNQFRQLLQESISRIDACAKKLGSCIVKARPYYDARIRAKEALQETQKAAVNFERANSAHSAAKEMVYLAEEGLRAEGRTFDHAWQEMLNHATMRVNESESERTVAETEHKRTSQNYQLAEIRVRTLQKELKRAITKSRPYFELKIHYTQALEKQKIKVKNLEKHVAEVKLNYAQTLKNLERISDEIHKTRQKHRHSELGKRSEGVGAEADFPSSFPTLYALPKAKSECGKSANGSQGDHIRRKDFGRDSETGAVPGDFGSEAEVPLNASPNSENDSSLTGPPDSESEEEVFKFPQKLNCFATMEVEAPGENADDPVLNPPEESIFEGVGICSFPAQTELNFNFEESRPRSTEDNPEGCWTEIKLSSPEEEIFSTVKVVNPSKSRSQLEEDFDVAYMPLSESEGRSKESDESPQKNRAEMVEERSETNGLDGMLCGLGGKTGKKEVEDGEEGNCRSLKGTPRKMNLRRQSLDVLWNNTAGEKMKEILSQGILKLNIGALTERKSIDSKMLEGNDLCEDEPSINNIKGNDSLYESNLTSQFGINFFNRKNSKAEDDAVMGTAGEDKKSGHSQDSISTQIGGFISRKERFSFKKVPSPLEKTLNYLNADEESNSDSESLARFVSTAKARHRAGGSGHAEQAEHAAMLYFDENSDMLTDEQLSSLVLDRDLAEMYQDIV